MRFAITEWRWILTEPTGQNSNNREKLEILTGTYMTGMSHTANGLQELMHFLDRNTKENSSSYRDVQPSQIAGSSNAKAKLPVCERLSLTPIEPHTDKRKSA